VLHVVPELAEAGGVRLPLLSTCHGLFKRLDDFSFLGGGVVPSLDFCFSLGDPLFGVSSFAIQKATLGARVTLMVVPKVTHSH